MRFTAKFLIIAFLFAFAACASVPSAHATTIFSNLGAGDTYNSTLGWTVGTVSGFTFDDAFQFTVGASSLSLSQIDVALTNISGTNGATVDLLSGSSSAPGALPSSVLGSWTLSGLPASGTIGTIQPSQEITGISGITLTAGTTYWLAALPASSTTVDSWMFNTVGATVSYADSSTAGSTWNALTVSADDYDGAFDVLGTTPTATTPEPATVPLLALGLAALAIALLRKGRAVPSATA